MAVQVRGSLTGQGYTQGRTAWLMSNPEGHGVQEVGFITVQMTKPSVPSCRPTVLRLREGIDAVPSGECPPHYGDRAPRVWNFLDDDFFRLSQAGALIHLKVWLAGAEQLFTGWAWGSPVRLGKPWGLALGGTERGPIGGWCLSQVWELLKLFGLHCQAWNWRLVCTVPQRCTPQRSCRWSALHLVATTRYISTWEICPLQTKTMIKQK